LIIPQVIRILGDSEWKVVVVYRSGTRRGMMRFVLITPQATIRIHFGEWEAVAVCRPRRGVKILKWYDVAIVVCSAYAWVLIPSELVNMEVLP
jgi:hypothetical protein